MPWGKPATRGDARPVLRGSGAAAAEGGSSFGYAMGRSGRLGGKICTLPKGGLPGSRARVSGESRAGRRQRRPMPAEKSAEVMVAGQVGG